MHNLHIAQVVYIVWVCWWVWLCGFWCLYNWKLHLVLPHQKTTCAYLCMLNAHACTHCALMTLQNRIRMRLVYFHKRDRTCLSWKIFSSTQLIKIKRHWRNLMFLYDFQCIKHCIPFSFVLFAILFYFLPIFMVLTLKNCNTLYNRI